MKLVHGHLSYCTNIHAGESWAEHFAALKKHIPVIKKGVSPDQAMGIGLRLSNSASRDILKADQLQIFKKWLSENDAYVFTMNGFPYGDFHHALVKDQVHAPDWTSNERLEYTLRLFDILAELLPEGLEGGISTSPLSYKYWFPTRQLAEKAMLNATHHIVSVAEHLYRIKEKKGIGLHLDIEPEPDGLLETGPEFIHWFENYMLPVAKAVLPSRLQITEAEAISCIKEHICLCYDVCHFAIGYEPMNDILADLSARGIRVGKIQISAALKAGMSADADLRKDTAEAFSKYMEPTYLHQVIARKSDRSLIRYRDLPDALKDAENLDVEEWRAHFHVPVFAENLGLLRSTRSDIVEILHRYKSNPFTDHLEVETYTWEVLPETLKLPIDQSIIRELNWVKAELK
ncbi:metabolite traffic protein EboE [Daejeonella sp. H1SJ63]|uniref:metabolite traffic protein EboE n=1 Tax=Daejeonella sp. H1SJ63 TaxID=3034145 RepID=UPI0023EA8FB2|nr:metabolite traffic protein EboE [Daejeonella sp. H1SJ63]